MRLSRRGNQEWPGMLPSSRTASDHTVPDQIATCASLSLPVRHQGRSPPGSASSPQHRVEVLQGLDNQIPHRRWRCRLLLSLLLLLQLTTLLLQFVEVLRQQLLARLQQRPTFFANSRYLRRSSESFLVRLKPLKLVAN